MKTLINMAFKVSLGVFIGLVAVALLMAVGIVPSFAQGIDAQSAGDVVTVPYGTDVITVRDDGDAVSSIALLISIVGSAGFIIGSILQRDVIPISAIDQLMIKLRQVSDRTTRIQWDDAAVDALDTGWLLMKGFIDESEKAMIDAKRSGQSLTDISIAAEAEALHTSNNMAPEPSNA